MSLVTDVFQLFAAYLREKYLHSQTKVVELTFEFCGQKKRRFLFCSRNEIETFMKDGSLESSCGKRKRQIAVEAQKKFERHATFEMI